MPEAAPTWTNLLLYDGVCGLCIRSVQAVLLRDPKGLIHFCSIQSELGSRLYREQGLDPSKPCTMVLLTPQGPYSRSDVAIALGRILGGRSRWLVLLKIIPRWVRDSVYRFIARHRYQWFGRRDECMLPRPEWQQRFVC